MKKFISEGNVKIIHPKIVLKKRKKSYIYTSVYRESSLTREGREFQGRRKMKSESKEFVLYKPGNAMTIGRASVTVWGSRYQKRNRSLKSRGSIEYLRCTCLLGQCRSIMRVLPGYICELNRTVPYV